MNFSFFWRAAIVTTSVIWVFFILSKSPEQESGEDMPNSNKSAQNLNRQRLDWKEYLIDSTPSFNDETELKKFNTSTPNQKKQYAKNITIHSSPIIDESSQDSEDEDSNRPLYNVSDSQDMEEMNNITSSQVSSENEAQKIHTFVSTEEKSLTIFEDSKDKNLNTSLDSEKELGNAENSGKATQNDNSSSQKLNHSPLLEFFEKKNFSMDELYKFFKTLTRLNLEQLESLSFSEKSMNNKPIINYFTNANDNCYLLFDLCLNHFKEANCIPKEFYEYFQRYIDNLKTEKEYIRDETIACSTNYCYLSLFDSTKNQNFINDGIFEFEKFTQQQLKYFIDTMIPYMRNSNIHLLSPKNLSRDFLKKAASHFSSYEKYSNTYLLLKLHYNNNDGLGSLNSEFYNSLEKHAKDILKKNQSSNEVSGNNSSISPETSQSMTSLSNESS